jgi:hypothetical protein
VTGPAKGDPARAWRYAEKLLDEEDDERLAKMTDEEVFAELDAEFGPPTGNEPTAEQMIAKMEARAAKPKPDPKPELTLANAQPAEPEPEAIPQRVRPLWRRPRVVVPAALALAAGVFLAIHAFTRPPRIGPDVLLPGEEQAINLRNDALQACNEADWPKCLDDLDRARALDPTGDATSGIRGLRAMAEQGIRDTPPPTRPAPRRGPEELRKIPK